MPTMVATVVPNVREEGQGASAEQEVLPALLVAGDPPTEQDHAREVGEEATQKQGGVHGTRR